MSQGGTGRLGLEERRTLGLALALVCLVGLGFARATTNDFVPFDDPDYVTGNPHVRGGLSVELLRWALTSTDAANWHPLTWLSHGLDVELWGLEAARHHGTSLLLHALNAGLCLWLVWRWTGQRVAAFFTAALFALHPLRVESFAWIAERKDVLSGLFFLLTLLAYGRYVRRPGAGSLALVGLAGAAAMTSKPTTVTLPFVLLLLDAWPHRRLGLGARRLLLEKLPLFLLAGLAAWMTVRAQTLGGTVAGGGTLGPLARAAGIAPNYLAYLEASVWPAGLACLYPHPVYAAPDSVGFLAPRSLLALGLLVAVTVFSLALRRRRPYLAVGWFWFLGMLVPVIGLVQAGAQSHADRYTYLPSLGLSLLVVLGVRDLVAGRPRLERGAAVLGGGVLAVLAVASWRQIGVWRDGETLFRHALAHTAKNHVIEGELGQLLARRGEVAEARGHLERAAELSRGPDEVANLGALLLMEGDLAAAEPLLKEAVELEPRHAPALNNLAGLRARQGRLEEALALAERALETDSAYALAHQTRGLLLEALGRPAEALAAYRRALELGPDLERARERMAALTGGAP